MTKPQPVFPTGLTKEDIEDALADARRVDSAPIVDYDVASGDDELDDAENWDEHVKSYWANAKLAGLERDRQRDASVIAGVGSKSTYSYGLGTPTPVTTGQGTLFSSNYTSTGHPIYTSRKLEYRYRALLSIDYDGVLRQLKSHPDRVDTSLIREAHRRGFAVGISTCNTVSWVARQIRRTGLAVVEDPFMTKDKWDGGRSGKVVLVTNRKLDAVAHVDDLAVNHRFGQDPEHIFDDVEKFRGFHACRNGNPHHWGWRGAAGISPFAIWNGKAYLLLGQRSKNVQEPGTWAGFGGAIEEGESAWKAANREMSEELRGLTSYRPSGTKYKFTCPHCGWTYTSYLVRVALDPEGKLPQVRVRDYGETTELRWVPLSKVGKYEQHSGASESWPVFKAAVEAALAASEREEAQAS